MEKIILIHGSGHKADSWAETVSRLVNRESVLCPELSALLAGKEASYPNLYAGFSAYCGRAGGPVHLCLLNVVFRLLPKSTFASMAFDKQDTFALGNSMKNLDFSGRVGAIQCPTLLLCGEKDGANLKSARFLAQNIPGAELQILQHTGHVVNEEALAEHLNAFYAAHS